MLLPRSATVGEGPWPDEYHTAAFRLRSALDELEDELTTGDFRLVSRDDGKDDGSGGDDDDSAELFDELVLRLIKESINESTMRTVCNVGYSFDKSILLCGI